MPPVLTPASITDLGLGGSPVSHGAMGSTETFDAPTADWGAIALELVAA